MTDARDKRPLLATDRHWHNVAVQYGLLGSPLRPCSEDARIIEEILAAEPEIFGSAGKKRAWLLGVTPGIVAVPWPQEVKLVAVERVRAMIDLWWAGNTENQWAICADWAQVPFPDQSFDLAIGDGCLTAVAEKDEAWRLLVSLRRCLRRDGYLLLRLFCRPEIDETPEAVIATLRSGSIGSFHAFKWRLAMAVQGKAGTPDVSVDDIWNIWNASGIDAEELTKTRGWPMELAVTLDHYRGATARYSFMRFDEAICHLQSAGFDLVATRVGSYELAERCPHVLLKKRQDNSDARSL